MAKETMYNGYKITVDVEKKNSEWRGYYMIRLNGAEIRSDRDMFLTRVETEIEAENVVFGIAQTHADRHHQGKDAL